MEDPLPHPSIKKHPWRLGVLEPWRYRHQNRSPPGARGPLSTPVPSAPPPLIALVPQCLSPSLFPPPLQSLPPPLFTHSTPPFSSLRTSRNPSRAVPKTPSNTTTHFSLPASH